MTSELILKFNSIQMKKKEELREGILALIEEFEEETGFDVSRNITYTWSNPPTLTGVAKTLSAAAVTYTPPEALIPLTKA